MTNVRIEMLDGLPSELAELPATILAELQGLVAEDAAIVKSREANLHAALERRYNERAAEARLAEGKDTGSAKLADGEMLVTVTAPKRVKWDQARLRDALDQLEPDTARHFAKLALSVEEKKFDAAEPRVRQILAAARTVETGKTAFAFSPLKDAGA